MNNSIEQIVINSDIFIDKCTIIYGSSGTGKSYLIMDILHKLSQTVPLAWIVCDTTAEPTYNNKDTIQKPYILNDISEDWLKSLWYRQEANTSFYKIANDMQRLVKLANFADSDIQVLISKANNTKNDFLSKATNDIERKKIEDKFQSSIIKLCKEHIQKNMHKFNGVQLSKEDTLCLKYLNFNPRIVIVFDDCSEYVKKMCKWDIMTTLLTKGRHHYITLLIAVHSDTYMVPALRKQARNILFTTQDVAETYFKRMPSTKTMKERLNSAYKIFINPQEYKKLLYITDTNEFRYVIAEINSFKFGSPEVREYADKIKVNELNCNLNNNPFYNNIINNI